MPPMKLRPNPALNTYAGDIVARAGKLYVMPQHGIGLRGCRHLDMLAR